MPVQLYVQVLLETSSSAKDRGRCSCSAQADGGDLEMHHFHGTSLLGDSSRESKVIEAWKPVHS